MIIENAIVWVAKQLGYDNIKEMQYKGYAHLQANSAQIIIHPWLNTSSFRQL